MKTGMLVMLVAGALATALLLVTREQAEEQPVESLLQADQVVVAATQATTARASVIEEAGSLISAGSSPTGVALIDLSSSTVEMAGDDEPFVLASVGKLYVLVAFLAEKEATGSSSTAYEMLLLEDMVQLSDNDAATALWYEAGGFDSLSTHLQDRQLPVPGEPENGSWGSLTATAEDVGRLLDALYNGRILSSENTELALGLLAQVADWQSWGISAGTAEDAIVLLKNGWYPADDGWRINSAGIVRTAGSAYALVILSDSQASYEAGIASVEEIALAVNVQLSEADSVALQP